MTTQPDEEPETAQGPQVAAHPGDGSGEGETAGETQAQAETEKTTAKPPRRRLFRRLVKTGLYLAGFLFVIFTVMANIGGNGDVFREGIENYLSGSTPYNAKIERLHAFYLFPEIVLDVENVELNDRGTEKTVITVGRARLAIGFFDVMFSRQRYRILELERAQAVPGSILDRPVAIARAGFIEDGEGRAFLAAVGTAGNQPFEIQAGFRPEGRQGRRLYSPAEEMEIRIALGDLARFRTVVKDDPDGDLALDNTVLRAGDREALKGDFKLERLGGGRFSLQGRAVIFPHGTVLNADLALNMGALPVLVKGAVQAAPFNVADFAPEAPLALATGEWVQAFGLPETALDLDLSLENFTAAGIDWGTVRTKLALENAEVKIGPLGGKIMDGELSGTALLKTAPGPATALDAQIDIRNLDYALLQQQLDKDMPVEGRADLWIDLGAKGEGLESLPAALSGKITFVAGKGRIGMAALASWGEGLPGILMQDMPKDAALDLTCAIADLDIKDGVARSPSVFIETAQAGIQAAGQYDFARDLLEATLHARPGNKAGGQPVSAHVRGPLAGLKATPGRFGASGGLAQDAAGPDFKPLSLPDRGLGADHPCRAFVIETEVLEPPVYGGKN